MKAVVNKVVKLVVALSVENVCITEELFAFKEGLCFRELFGQRFSYKQGNSKKYF